MFENFTFEKKLGIDSSERKYYGLKVGTLSLLVAFVGVLCVVLGAVSLGRILIVVSFLGMCVGMVVHFCAMARGSTRKRGRD